MKRRDRSQSGKHTLFWSETLGQETWCPEGLFSTPLPLLVCDGHEWTGLVPHPQVLQIALQLIYKGTRTTDAWSTIRDKTYRRFLGSYLSLSTLLRLNLFGRDPLWTEDRGVPPTRRRDSSRSSSSKTPRPPSYLRSLIRGHSWSIGVIVLGLSTVPLDLRSCPYRLFGAGGETSSVWWRGERPKGLRPSERTSRRRPSLLEKGTLKWTDPDSPPKPSSK